MLLMVTWLVVGLVLLKLDKLGFLVKLDILHFAVLLNLGSLVLMKQRFVESKQSRRIILKFTVPEDEGYMAGQEKEDASFGSFSPVPDDDTAAPHGFDVDSDSDEENDKDFSVILNVQCIWNSGNSEYPITTQNYHAPLIIALPDLINSQSSFLNPQLPKA